MGCEPGPQWPFAVSQSHQQLFRFCPFPWPPCVGRPGSPTASFIQLRKCSGGWASSLKLLRLGIGKNMLFSPGRWGSRGFQGPTDCDDSPWWIDAVSSDLKQNSESSPVWEGDAGGPIPHVGLLPLALPPPLQPSPPPSYYMRWRSGVCPIVRPGSCALWLLHCASLGTGVLSSWRALSHSCCVPPTSFSSPTLARGRNPQDCTSLSSLSKSLTSCWPPSLDLGPSCSRAWQIPPPLPSRFRL